MELLNDIAVQYNVSRKDAGIILDKLGAPKKKIYRKYKGNGGSSVMHYEVTDRVKEKFQHIVKLRDTLLKELEITYCDLNIRTALPIMILRASISFLYAKGISLTEIGLILHKHHSTIHYHLDHLKNKEQHRLYPAIKKDVYEFLEEQWKS